MVRFFWITLLRNYYMFYLAKIKKKRAATAVAGLSISTVGESFLFFFLFVAGNNWIIKHEYVWERKKLNYWNESRNKKYSIFLVAQSVSILDIALVRSPWEYVTEFWMASTDADRVGESCYIPRFPPSLCYVCVWFYFGVSRICCPPALDRSTKYNFHFFFNLKKRKKSSRKSFARFLYTAEQQFEARDSGRSLSLFRFFLSRSRSRYTTKSRPRTVRPRCESTTCTSTKLLLNKKKVGHNIRYRNLKKW